jgi:hypothetical protein
MERLILVIDSDDIIGKDEWDREWAETETLP